MKLKWKKIGIIGIAVLFLIGGFWGWNQIGVVKRIEEESFLDAVLEESVPQFLDMDWYSSEKELEKHHFTFSKATEVSFDEILLDQELYLKDLECSGKVICTYNKIKYENYEEGLSIVELFFYKDTEEELYQLYKEIETEIREYYEAEERKDNLIDHIEIGDPVILEQKEWVSQYWVLKNHACIGIHQFFHIQQEYQNDTRIGDAEKGYYLTLQLRAYLEY